MLANVLFWSVFATILAAIEVESEGKYGWAEKMPTWYRYTGLIAGLYGKLFSGKPLTGYHSFMFILPVMIFHAHFFNGVTWSIEGELHTWALYFGWCVLWDYLWFVLNPAYRGHFQREAIWWHAKNPWVFGWFPIDYLFGVLFSILLAGAAAFRAGRADLFYDHLCLLGGWCAYTVLLYLLAPLYHRWYYAMRERDERRNN